MQREQLIAIARGDRPAELVLRGGRMVNVLAGEVHPADVDAFRVVSPLTHPESN